MFRSNQRECEREAYACLSAVGFRYNEYRDGEEDESEDVRVLFANATDDMTDISNALALDMTYRVLYYGQHNKVT